MKLVRQRNPEETNLFPVLAMFLSTDVGKMLRAVGFASDYSPQGAENRWIAVKQIAERNGMQWFTQELETHVRMPEQWLTIPNNGSGIIYTWSFNSNGGLTDDRVIKSICVEAFENDVVFDPCFEQPIPGFVYQQMLDAMGGKVVKIIWREGRP